MKNQKQKGKTINPKQIQASITMYKNESVFCHFRRDGDNIFNLSFEVTNYVGLTKLRMLKRAFEQPMNKKRADLNKIDYDKIFEDVIGIPAK